MPTNEELLALIKQLQERVWVLETRAGIAQPAQGISTEELDREMGTLILQGRRIAALKLHREHRGSGLREAKEYTDLLIDRLQAWDVPVA